MQRRLAAIMVADFVDSTSAMESDEERAVTCVTACMKAVGDVVARHEGRVFNTAGDAVLAEFSSPVNALRAAMEARNAIASVPGATAGDMRFGLHLADVVVMGGDLRGDGVNVAARVQSAAEAGEIDVTGALYDYVRRVSPCAFEQVGERKFKGVSEPIRVYRVGPAIDRHRFQSAPTRNAPPSPIHPNSVAVTPFSTATSSDQDQSFLAEGLTDDLTRTRPIEEPLRQFPFRCDGARHQRPGRNRQIAWCTICGRGLGAQARLACSAQHFTRGDGAGTPDMVGADSASL
jgi:adenylate cyclase